MKKNNAERNFLDELILDGITHRRLETKPTLVYNTTEAQRVVPPRRGAQPVFAVNE